jgi:signal recognition particle receptor subunit beta
MALINYASREINSKIVFYGPGLGGKTTNIKYVYTKLQPTLKGRLISLATELDRTLFFDFLPVDIGTIRGFKTRFHLYTVPGQVFYNASRKLILKGVDGIVFVADSQIERFDENIESFDNMKDNLRSYNLDINKIPLVIQYNKRDLPNITSIEELQKVLNPDNKYAYFEAIATQGVGVFETLKEICKMVLKMLA